MRRQYGLCMMAIILLLLCTACKSSTVAGVWASDEPSDYYFELYEDGSCMMFDEHNEWVSSGTYIEYEDSITFVTDTGQFTWVWDEESEAMLFEAGEDTFHFRQQENN